MDISPKPRLLFPFPVLVGDIGGTNARFALVEAPGAAPRPVARLKTAEEGDAASGIAKAIAASGSVRPRSVVVCGAGPLIGRRLQLTNAGWRLDGPELAAALKLDQGMILNDFEAQALSLPVLPPDAFRPIGAVTPREAGARVAIGPGTGLGLATLLDIGGCYQPVPSEAGHVDVGPLGPEEEAIWPHIERVAGRLTSECLLSGSGLLRLHRARLMARGLADDLATPAAVGDAALDGRSDEAVATVRLFWRLLARFAGDMALVVMARGGVSIMGGIGPRLSPLLDVAAFRAAFEGKAPMEAVMAAIPTSLVVETDAALHGLAGLASTPERFLLDYDNRLWR